MPFGRTETAGFLTRRRKNPIILFLFLVEWGVLVLFSVRGFLCFLFECFTPLSKDFGGLVWIDNILVFSCVFLAFGFFKKKQGAGGKGINT